MEAFRTSSEFCKYAKVTFIRAVSGKGNDWTFEVVPPRKERVGPVVPNNQENRSKLQGSTSKDCRYQSNLQIMLRPLQQIRALLAAAAHEAFEKMNLAST